MFCKVGGPVLRLDDGPFLLNLFHMFDACLSVAMIGSVCDFLVFWLQSAIEFFALFHYSGFSKELNGGFRAPLSSLLCFIIVVLAKNSMAI